jgi:2-methylcitrate dehydratase PrpD
MASGKTDQLADYLEGAPHTDLPEAVIQQAKWILLDTFGITLGASAYRAGKLASKFAASAGGAPECTLLGFFSKNSAVHAAFANGVMAHDFDMDDSHAASLSHPAAVIVPAAWAAGEREGASGMDLIRAIVAGYDVECRLSIALDPQRQYARNFHPSSVCGCFGAGAAAGTLLNLNRNQSVHMLGLSGCQASGLLAWETETGHMSKSFQTGIAARNGVVAALLANEGYQGPPSIFDGPYNLFEAFSSDAFNFEPLTQDLGTRFEIMNTSLKLYSSCRHTHAPLDAFFHLIKAHGLDPAEIREVVVKVAPGALPVINGNELLTHNMQYVIAVAAVIGNVTPDQVLQKSNDPRIGDFSKRVKVVAEPRFTDRFPARKSGIVSISTMDGQVIEQQVDDAKGDFRNPLSLELIEQKFVSLVTPFMPESAAREIIDMVYRLESTPDIRPLMERFMLNENEES